MPIIRSNLIAFTGTMAGAAVVAWLLLQPLDSLVSPLGYDPAPVDTSPVRAPEVVGDEALLEPRSPRDVRRVLAFTRGATASDVATLRQLALCSESPLVAGNALRALGRLRAVADDGALLALRDDARLRVRQELVVALGASSDARMVAPLVAMMQDGGSALRPLVLQALGGLGGTAAREVLQRVMQDPGVAATDRVFARQALASVAMRTDGDVNDRTRVR